MWQKEATGVHEKSHVGAEQTMTLGLPSLQKCVFEVLG